ncbi:MAG: phage tail protein [Granulosicoccus sp.]|nr:phage tail protein [Granulosicoccus sp.]
MTYPLTAYHFKVEWGGARIGFTEVSGLEQAVQPVLYREGSSASYAPMVIPGLPGFENIVLKRGMMANDNEFFDWIDTIRLNQVERRDVTISLLNAEHDPGVVWKVRNAWPVRLQGPLLDATRNAVAIELLELAHEGLRVEVL